MEELTKKLIKEIQNISKIIEEYQEYENEFKKYKYTENINDNPKNKMILNFISSFLSIEIRDIAPNNPSDS